MSIDVTKVSAVLPISAELLGDWIDHSSAAIDEAYRDMTEGPRLRPGRAQYNGVMAPIWRRERLREEFAAMGRPAGPYVRRPHAK